MQFFASHGSLASRLQKLEARLDPMVAAGLNGMERRSASSQFPDINITGLWPARLLLKFFSL